MTKVQSPEEIEKKKVLNTQLGLQACETLASSLDTLQKDINFLKDYVVNYGLCDEVMPHRFNLIQISLESTHDKLFVIKHCLEENASSEPKNVLMEIVYRKPPLTADNEAVISSE